MAISYSELADAYHVARKILDGHAQLVQLISDIALSKIPPEYRMELLYELNSRMNGPPDEAIMQLVRFEHEYDREAKKRRANADAVKRYRGRNGIGKQRVNEGFAAQALRQTYMEESQRAIQDAAQKAQAPQGAQQFRAPQSAQAPLPPMDPNDPFALDERRAAYRAMYGVPPSADLMAQWAAELGGPPATLQEEEDAPPRPAPTQGVAPPRRNDATDVLEF